MLSRVKARWKRIRPTIKLVVSVIAEILKFAALGCIIFIAVPQIYELTSISERLDANIYDFYGVLILVYLTYRIHVLELLVKSLKKPERVYLSMEDDELNDDEWFKVN